MILDAYGKQSLILTIKLINLGDFSWSPKDNTYYHFLTIDLGARVKIRAIATQGQSNTKECVTEYILQYSDNGQLWRSYSGNTGEAEVGTEFKKNHFSFGGGSYI